MKPNIFHVIICLLAGASVLAAQETPADAEAEPEVRLEFRLASPGGAVLPKKNRSEAIAASEYYLSPGSANFDERVDAVVNPFRFKEEEPVQPVDGDDDQDGPDTEPEVREYSSDEVLAGAAQALQPQITGTMIMGDNRLLLRGNANRPMRVGDTFNVRVPAGSDNLYTIELIDIQQKAFTLRLGDNQVVVPIGEMPGGSGITQGG